MVGILVSDRSHRVQRRAESCCHCAMSPKPCCRKLVSQALQRFCEGKVGLSYLPPGSPWDNGYIESFNNRLRKECLNRNHWNSLFEARVVIGDFKHEHNHRHRHSALGYRTPTSTLRRAGTPTPRSPARSTESGPKQPDSKSGWTPYRVLQGVLGGSP